jgi:hypothetical protein
MLKHHEIRRKTDRQYKSSFNRENSGQISIPRTRTARYIPGIREVSSTDCRSTHQTTKKFWLGPAKKVVLAIPKRCLLFCRESDSILITKNENPLSSAKRYRNVIAVKLKLPKLSDKKLTNRIESCHIFNKGIWIMGSETSIHCIV